MVSRISEYMDPLQKAEADATYWRLSFADEVKIARVERYAALTVGFFVGAAITGLVCFLSLWG